MLDRLPSEIVDIILRHIDPDYDHALHPAYTFTLKSRDLLPLIRVSRGWRDTIQALLASYTSLVRSHETQKVDTSPRGISLLNVKAATTLELMKNCYGLVHELEVHSHIDLMRCRHFNNIEALTILGNTNVQSRSHIQFEHLEYIALAISSKVFTIQSLHKLKRLDLLLDSNLSYDSLAGFQGPNLEELNTLNKGITSSLTMKPLVKFIAGLTRLKKLTLRKKLSKFAASTPSEQSSIKEFFDTINKLSLEELAIDMPYLRAAPVSKFLSRIPRVELDSIRVPLTITLIEPSLAGQWTDDEERTILNYLIHLSSHYEVKKMRVIYGIQTEITPHATTSGFIKFLRLIEDEKCTFLSTLTTFHTMKAWNILDDSQLFLQQQRDPYSIMSYETNATFSPNYRKLVKYERWDRGENSIILLLKGESLDPEFWSGETVLQHLFKYAEDKPKSSLWS